MSSALGIMSSIRFACWQSPPTGKTMSSTLSTARALPTTLAEKEEVDFDVEFDDPDFDDEHGVEVDEDIVLPPITHLDRRSDSMTLPKLPLPLPTPTTTKSSSPLLESLPEPEPTPLPQLLPARTQPSTETQGQILTPITSTVAAAAMSTISTLALAPAPPAYQVDWLDFTRTRSAHFIAEKTCEMICYLWFSVPSHARAQLKGSASPSKSGTTSSTTSLQLTTTPAFVSYMQKLLETTQVSQSVIVLSLHYIHRLKESNVYMPAQQGSEFRIAVAGLMMANKFLDDNTYTNKTWSEVSGISLNEINRMEIEFLQGVGFNLYVDKSTYASWLNLLKGLVLAKERDARRWLKGAHGHGHSTSKNATTPRKTGGGARERDGKSWHPHRPVRPLQLHPPPTLHPPSFAHASMQQDQDTASLQIPDLFSTRRQSADTTHTNSHANNAHIGAGVDAGAHTCTPYDVYCRPRPKHRTRARSTSPRSFRTKLVGKPRPEPQDMGYSHSQLYQGTSVYTHTTPSTSTEIGYNHPDSHHAAVGTKRSASDAFSPPQPAAPVYPASVKLPSIPSVQPTAVSNSVRPSPTKRSTRPTDVYPGLYSLQIPEFISGSNLNSTSTASLAVPGSHGTAPSTSTNTNGVVNGGTGSGNPSPLEGLGAFERMSLGEESIVHERTRDKQERRIKKMKTMDFEEEGRVVPHTLVAAYEYGVTQRRAEGPKKLFFYTLSCSPSTDEEDRSGVIEQHHPSIAEDDAQDTEYLPQLRGRKAKLRCQAAVPINRSCPRCGCGWAAGYADLNGGCCPPNGFVSHGQALPPPATATYLQQQPAQSSYPSTSPTANMAPTTLTPAEVSHSLRPHPDVPSAPFANAGPPGVGAGFYATPEVEMVRVTPIYGGYQQQNYATYAYSPEVSVGSVANSNPAPSRHYAGSTSLSNAPPATALAPVSTSTAASNLTSHSPSTYTYTYNYSGSHSTNSSPYHAALGGYRYTQYSTSTPGGTTYASEYAYSQNHQNRIRMVSGYARY